MVLPFSVINKEVIYDLWSSISYVILHHPTISYADAMSMVTSFMPSKQFLGNGASFSTNLFFNVIKSNTHLHSFPLYLSLLICALFFPPSTNLLLDSSLKYIPSSNPAGRGASFKTKMFLFV